jgi:hypothetical protein
VAARIAALLTVRRYGGTTASRIGSDYLVLCSAFPRFGASAITPVVASSSAEVVAFESRMEDPPALPFT